MMPWQPILETKLAKLADSPLWVALAFQNRVERCNSNFKSLGGDELATV